VPTPTGGRAERKNPQLAGSKRAGGQGRWLRKKCKFTAENAENADVTHLLQKIFSATSAVEKPFLRLHQGSSGLLNCPAEDCHRSDKKWSPAKNVAQVKADSIQSLITHVPVPQEIIF
jgi:hypothetical protein